MELNISVFNSSCLENDLFSYTLMEKGSFVNFKEAQSLCLENDGNLARITNKNEQDFVNEFRISAKNTWIGIDATNTPDGGQSNPKNFFFTDGSQENLDFFQDVERGEFPWFGDEPNEFKNKTEDCVQLFNSLNLWNNEDCNKKEAAFACRVVNSNECRIEEDNEETGSSLFLGFLLGFMVILMFMVVIFFIFKPKRKEFVLYDLNKKGNGIRPQQLSAHPPPQVKRPIFDTEFEYTEQSKYSEASRPSESTFVSDVFSVDTTGVDYRKSSEFGRPMFNI